MPFLDFQSKQKVKLFDGVNASLFHSDDITFAHVVLEEGAIVPEHNHVHEQWTHIIEGQAEFNINGEIKLLNPGMAAHMPSNVRHGVKAITLCKVIDCFFTCQRRFCCTGETGIALSSPSLSIQTPILDSFSKMFRFNVIASGEVGYCAAYFKYAVVSAGAEI
jgi:quercetin dioxygenase-like cupin family protein